MSVTQTLLGSTTSNWRFSKLGEATAGLAVGDLIDRGPGVLDGLKLLGEPWFYTVKGNHEWMLINAYRQDPHARYASHGAGWWSTIADESKPMIIERLESLPLAIEIETVKGLVGVVHADVPT